jgi:hypothetical protein
MFPDLDKAMNLASAKCINRDEHESVPLSAHVDTRQDNVSIRIYLPLNGNMVPNPVW